MHEGLARRFLQARVHGFRCILPLISVESGRTGCPIDRSSQAGAIRQISPEGAGVHLPENSFEKQMIVSCGNGTIRSPVGKQRPNALPEPISDYPVVFAHDNLHF
ncbi:MAG: hypothetical protein TE42_03695 [Candidatus Synechococcus spongiarum SP3]|uniref:Uncharacterized protein n=1 Tax=Candidatus Synechococcus spongiarum SP3 TaxID=1604020 RepID=A0A0G2HLP6_9SYNE|nr:MAG: hypothetical protein TE42_03695 [Candidatus Synechococcus spongiarum SP3]